jgi:hypothetical protein
MVFLKSRRGTGVIVLSENASFVWFGAAICVLHRPARGTESGRRLDAWEGRYYRSARTPFIVGEAPLDVQG